MGSYDGGGRGKERDKEKEREKEAGRETASNSHFSFDPEPLRQTGSPSAPPTEEPPSLDRSLEGSSTTDSTDARNRESITTKEVKGASRPLLWSVWNSHVCIHVTDVCFKLCVGCMEGAGVPPLPSSPPSINHRALFTTSTD